MSSAAGLLLRAGTSSFSADLERSTLMLRLGSAAFLALFVGYALWQRRRQDARRRRWAAVRGTVTGERWQGHGVGDNSSSDPVIVFRTEDGTEITGSPRGGMYLGMNIVGREVPVWYDPQNPHRFEARIYALDRDGSMALLIAIVPALLLLASFAP